MKFLIGAVQFFAALALERRPTARIKAVDICCTWSLHSFIPIGLSLEYSRLNRMSNEQYADLCDMVLQNRLL